MSAADKGFVPPLHIARTVAREMHTAALPVDIHDHSAVVEALAALRTATGWLLDALDEEDAR